MQFPQCHIECRVTPARPGGIVEQKLNQISFLLSMTIVRAQLSEKQFNGHQ